ncbi:transport and Golgi organization 11 [Leptinotarsa decemlineata]|uniref:transport and Golgi organization 11 n=1 Tax=Leptinotarsa decemlineata TaxID=7539 RepID=UPI003D305547
MSSNDNFLRYTEDDFVSDPAFKMEMNQKMNVPDKIRFGPDENNDHLLWRKENLNMNVPDRILVAGHHQHVGTKAPPPEIVFDNCLLASEPYPRDLPRVATPPRVLTLDKYSFPGIEDTEESDNEFEPSSKVHFDNPNPNSFKESSQPVLVSGEGTLSSAEELLHLRRQMAKLNRRVMTLELENINRLQKEKIVVGFGIAYFLFKLIIWMNKE